MSVFDVVIWFNKIIDLLHIGKGQFKWLKIWKKGLKRKQQ